MELVSKYPTVVNKYPTYLKLPSYQKTRLSWLQSRMTDDGAEGLWRIHDKLYDLSDFAHEHPGGKEWLTLTKVRRLI